MSAEKHKVGDRVVVKSFAWYDENKNERGEVRVPCCFINSMAAFCGVIRDGRVGVATSISKERKFAFPTPEMADAFGKNFKKELEACKEILNDK